MGAPELQLSELLRLNDRRRLSTVFGAPRDEPVLIVHLDADDSVPREPALARGEIGVLPAVIVGIGPIDHPAKGVVDVIVEPDLSGADLTSLLSAVADRPLASVALCMLLRHGDRRSIAAGLVAESATYSMLQAGPEFQAWLRTRSTGPEVTTDEPSVVVERQGDIMVVSLNRPHRHNAMNVAMSELLTDALTDALAEPQLQVVLRGNGPSFSSGGDLREFGLLADPASAHAVRLSRSVGHLLALLADRTHAHLHGNSVGAGIELPAFAGTVVAAPDTTISLPELSLGLVPGAGGTVSLPRRIGRHRTALMALSGISLDAATAHDWQLVDRLDGSNTATIRD